jgi:protein subunit release factor B
MEDKKDRKPLLSIGAKDCRMDVFRAGGKGGQKQNKTNSGVRWVHEPSGAVGESREFAEQIRNKRTAWRRMCETPEMKKWIRIESLKRMGELRDIEAKVDKAMDEKYIRTDIQDEKGNWAPYDEVRKP